MLRLGHLSAGLLAITALALPLDENTGLATNGLQKRANPSIGPGFSSRQVQQIEDGIKDAQELASYVVMTPAQYVDPVMEKYFNKADFQTVRSK